jgi:cytochrome c
MAATPWSMVAGGPFRAGRFNMKQHTRMVLAAFGIVIATGVTSGCAPFECAPDAAFTAPTALDAVAAKALAQKDSCLRCHGMTREKRGPAYSAIAARYKDRPDAELCLYLHLTTGDGPAMPEEHEDSHKVIQQKRPGEIRNLVRWILAQ